MADFSSSFNLFLGTSNKDIDWFDNEYLQVKVYELDEMFEPKESEHIKMRLCDKENDLNI